MKPKTIKSQTSYLTNVLIFLAIGVVVFAGLSFYFEFVRKSEILKKIIERLSADSRIAEVIVTDTTPNPLTQKPTTTIKFLEYDALGNPMKPKYFTFSSNLIQFQSLVVRFDDLYIERADALRGKSAYLFWKVFSLNGAKTEEFDINKINEVPDGYRVESENNETKFSPKMVKVFEQEIWQKFWNYALDERKAQSKGVKNAQIEAPGTMFVPGILYTLRIEHDGGIRIDAQEIPSILKGEKVLQ